MLISALVTSVFLHDSQVAILLIKLASYRETYLYDLLDAAYDVQRLNRSVGSLDMF